MPGGILLNPSAAGLADCCCDQGSKICVLCGTVPIPGANVTVEDGSTVLDSGTTGDDGCIAVDVPAGLHTVVVSATGHATSTTSHSFTGSGTYTVDLCYSCGTCALPLVNLTYHMKLHGVLTSRVATYHPGTANDPRPSWNVIGGTMICEPGRGWVITVPYYDADFGIATCELPLSGTCDPVNLVVSQSDFDLCTNFELDTGIGMPITVTR